MNHPFHVSFSVHAPSQWETTLQCNVVSHWLGAYTTMPVPHWPGWCRKPSLLGQCWPTARPGYGSLSGCQGWDSFLAPDCDDVYRKSGMHSWVSSRVSAAPRALELPPPWLVAAKERDLLILKHVNTLRPRQDGRHFPDAIFKCIFLNENVLISIKISLKFVPKGPINNFTIQHWFR